MFRLKSGFFSLFIALLSLIICAKPSFGVTLPFRIIWDRNTESDLAYYTVHYGTSSRHYTHIIDVDKAYPYCEFGAEQLEEGKTYYIALTATDFSLNESNYSDELIVFIEPSLTTTTNIPFCNQRQRVPCLWGWS